MGVRLQEAELDMGRRAAAAEAVKPSPEAEACRRAFAAVLAAAATLAACRATSSACRSNTVARCAVRAPCRT